MKPYTPKDLPPEEINRSDEKPLFNFFSTTLMVGGLLCSIYIFFIFLGFVLSHTVPVEIEYKYFNKIWTSKKADNKKVDANKVKLASLTDELWGLTVPNTNIKFNPQVTTSDMPNAFITPGAHIIVTDQLLIDTESENELSFVLCHELGHFYNRDTMGLLGQQIFTGIFHMLIGSSATVSTGLPALTQFFINSSFSRNQESKADLFAIGCMNKKYKHLAGHSHFFEKIKKLEPQLQSKYFSTHPLTDDRISDLKKFIKDRKLPIKGELTPFTWGE